MSACEANGRSRDAHVRWAGADTDAASWLERETQPPFLCLSFGPTGPLRLPPPRSHGGQHVQRAVEISGPHGCAKSDLLYRIAACAALQRAAPRFSEQPGSRHAPPEIAFVPRIVWCDLDGKFSAERLAASAIEEAEAGGWSSTRGGDGGGDRCHVCSDTLALSASPGSSSPSFSSSPSATSAAAKAAAANTAPGGGGHAEQASHVVVHDSDDCPVTAVLAAVTVVAVRDPGECAAVVAAAAGSAPVAVVVDALGPKRTVGRNAEDAIAAAITSVAAVGIPVFFSRCNAASRTTAGPITARIGESIISLE